MCSIRRSYSAIRWLSDATSASRGSKAARNSVLSPAAKSLASLAACRTCAVALRKISPALARHSPAPCALPPARLVPGSPSDEFALPRCDAAPDSASEDPAVPTAPASGRPAGHLFDCFPRSAARSAHAPRSLHVPAAVNSRLTQGEWAPVSSAIRLRGILLKTCLIACFVVVASFLLDHHFARFVQNAVIGESISQVHSDRQLLAL